MNKLCAIVRTGDGVGICEVVEHTIYDPNYYVPVMAVRAFEGRALNAMNRLIVPMRGPFFFENINGKVQS